jgi:SAM-dependent methyltransferase
MKKNILAIGLRLLWRLGLYSKFQPIVGQVRLGDLNRTRPLSECFGYDRGGPIDRYYIENFLQAESAGIRGRTLEIGDNAYTLRFGGDGVLHSDILHVDESNPFATIIGDLAHAPHIPENHFDCIILTQTLHLVYDYKAVIRTCCRILKPGGTLLLTVPGISHIDYGEWGQNWLWSFTDRAMEKIMTEVFPNDRVEINTFGNVLVATAFLYGMGLPEMKQEALDKHDSHYQVIVTAKAVKPAAHEPLPVD